MYATIVKKSHPTLINRTDLWGWAVPRHKLETAKQDYINYKFNPDYKDAVMFLAKVHRRLEDGNSKIPLQKIPIGDTGEYEYIDYPDGSFVTIIKTWKMEDNARPNTKHPKLSMSYEDYESDKYHAPYDWRTTWEELGITKV
jgi:hypothetical protein